jgi:hypothetical protein
MKSSFLKRVALILLISIMGSGCTMEDMLYGVVVENENGMLKKAVNGVEFSFCLLNEKGEVTTVFRQGENFSFQFLIKNKTDESLPFYDYGFYNTYDFFTVRSGADYLGKPMKFLKYSPVAEIREMAPDATETFSVPWQEERSEFQQMHGYFEGLNQPLLPKGKYYTKFTYNFKFGYPGKAPKIETGKMTFIINFEVK